MEKACNFFCCCKVELAQLGSNSLYLTKNILTKNPSNTSFLYIFYAILVMLFGGHRVKFFREIFFHFFFGKILIFAHCVKHLPGNWDSKHSG